MGRYGIVAPFGGDWRHVDGKTKERRCVLLRRRHCFCPARLTRWTGWSVFNFRRDKMSDQFKTSYAPRHGAAEGGDLRRCGGAHLQHDGADVSHALSDGLRRAGDGDGPLGGVRQHVPRHLHLSARGLGPPDRADRGWSLQRNKPPPGLKRRLQDPQIVPQTCLDMQGAAAADAPIFEETHKTLSTQN